MRAAPSAQVKIPVTLVVEHWAYKLGCAGEETLAVWTSVASAQHCRTVHSGPGKHLYTAMKHTDTFASAANSHRWSCLTMLGIESVGALAVKSSRTEQDTQKHD